MKEKKILLNYLIYILTGLLICFIGITGVFADTFNPSSALQYYEYYQGGTKKENSVNYGNNILLGSSSSINYPYAMSLILYGNYLQDKTYTLNVNVDTYFESEYFKFYYENLNYLIVSAQIVSGSERTLCNLQPITQNQKYSIGCTFKPTTNLSQVILSLVNYDYQNNGYVPFGSGDYVKFNNYNMAVYDNSSNIIIDQNNTIINQNNQNTQQIIDSSASNTQAIIDANKKNYEDCDYKTYEETWKDAPIDTYGLSCANGSQNSTSSVKTKTSNYIAVMPNKSYTLELNTRKLYYNMGFCEYNENKELIQCQCISGRSIINFTTSANTNYIRTTLGDEQDFTLKGEVCTNTLKENEKTSKGILGKIKELFSWFNNDDDADVSGLDNMVGWLPPGPVDSIINLPLAFFNALTNTLTGTCQSVSIPIPFVNQTLTLPCFDAYMSQYLTGFNTLWTLVGTILSVFILYYYLLSLYKWVDDTLTFRENNLPGYYGDNWGGGA